MSENSRGSHNNGRHHQDNQQNHRNNHKGSDPQHSKSGRSQPRQNEPAGRYGLSPKNTKSGGGVIKPPKDMMGSKAYAGFASVAGAGLVASNFVPKLRPLSLIFRSAATVAMSTADAKRLQERESAWENHQKHAKILADQAKNGTLKTRPAPLLTTRDHVRLSFLADNELDKLPIPVQAEVLKVQTLLEIDALQELGVSVEGDLEAYKAVSPYLYSQSGIDILKQERARIWDVMDSLKDGRYDAEKARQNAQDRQTKMLVRMGTMQGLNMAARKAGKYGKYLRGAFTVSEGVRVVVDSAKIITAKPLPHFDSPDDYAEHLIARVESLRAGGKQPARKFGVFPPRFHK